MWKMYIPVHIINLNPSNVTSHTLLFCLNCYLAETTLLQHWLLTRLMFKQPGCLLSVVMYSNSVIRRILLFIKANWQLD